METVGKTRDVSPKERLFSLLRASQRFFIPLILVSCAKLLGSVFLYYKLNMGFSDTYWMTVDPGPVGQNEVLTSAANLNLRQFYPFLGWDSAFYLSIVTKGYAFSDQSYSFFPGLPLFGWIINLVLQNPIVALVAFSTFTGIVWVPLYQLVAENYLNRSEALKSTLFYAFFPYVFLFTTVVYGEGLFLFSTLSAWYSFKRGKNFVAMVFASIATISRPPGLLALLPIFIEMLKTNKPKGSSFHRNFFYLLIPFSFFFAWLLYCQTNFGDWFASFNRTGWNEMYSFRVFIFDILPRSGIQAFSEIKPHQILPLLLMWMPFILISPILIYGLRRIDKSLAVYSMAYFLGVLAFGGLASIPRFISFIFPMWLPLTSKLFQAKRSNLITWIVCTSFFLIGLFLWFSFLNGEFVS